MPDLLWLIHVLYSIQVAINETYKSLCGCESDSLEIHTCDENILSSNLFGKFLGDF